MTKKGRPLRAIATGQRGYFTRQQANAGGVTDAMLRSRTQSGLLQKHGKSTFSGAFLDPTALDELQALILDIGGDVWAFGPTGSALLRHDGFVLKAPFHLLTERNRNVHRVGHYIHTVKEGLPLIDRAIAHGIPTTSATRTIIDLARHGTPEEVTRALDSALRDLQTTEAFLHKRISKLRTKGRYGIPKLLEIIEGSEITRGGHSWLERRFLELVVEAGLPKPETQVVMSRAGDRLIRVDCYFRDADLVVEVLGYRWHRTELQMSIDARRANQLTLEGKRFLQFTYKQIAETPRQTMKVLRTALEQPRPTDSVRAHIDTFASSLTQRTGGVSR
jgi:very-short-patch-repair endonuclease